ncbi:MAG TPA: alpha/beta fold hydrolase [Ramlibacter sp.]|nr:alpha/beta fold hydrolase [Ramlibacter sp.]
MQHELALVPGLNNTAAVFQGVLAALPAKVHAHALDNPPLDTVEAIAQHWLERLPERFWLAGFSFGGYVSLAMLAAAPERVRGIAMICTAPHADSQAAAQRRLAALDAVAQGRYHEMVDAQAPNAFHPDSLANTALMSARRDMARDYGPERYAAHVRATAARPDRSALLDGRIPTLVVTACGDKVIPPETVQAYARNIPGARVELVQGAGHLLPMEQPAELARLLAQWMDGSA